MKQVFADRLCEQIALWSKKHNIIGGKDPCELLVEAAHSLESLPEAESKSPLLVDIGAGAGLMGFAWVFSEPSSRQALFVEPDLKSSSFLRLAISLFPELKGKLHLCDQRFELVPRETASDLSSDFFLVSRAFSPASALRPLYSTSAFCGDPFYVFFRDPKLPKEPKAVLQLLP